MSTFTGDKTRSRRTRLQHRSRARSERIAPIQWVLLPRTSKVARLAPVSNMPLCASSRIYGEVFETRMRTHTWAGDQK